jgi:hypothetical protein
MYVPIKMLSAVTDAVLAPLVPHRVLVLVHLCQLMGIIVGPVDINVLETQSAPMDNAYNKGTPHQE